MNVEREFHLRDLAAIATKHWRVVALLTVVVPIGAFFTGRRAIDTYQSSLTIQISSPKQIFARLDDIDVDELALRTDPILSEALVLTTQTLARGVVDRVGLALELTELGEARRSLVSRVVVDSQAREGTYVLARDGEGYIVRDAAGRVLDSLPYSSHFNGPGFSFAVAPTGEPDEHEFRIIDRDIAAAPVRAGISYAVREGTNAVDVYFTGTDWTLVPRILNAVGIELRDHGANRARVAAELRTQYILDQIAEADANYQLALAELENYKQENLVTDLSAEQLVLSQEMLSIDRDRRLLLIQINTFEDVLRSTNLEAIELANSLAPLAGMSQNPALDHQIQTLLTLYDERRSLTAGPLGLQDENPAVDALDQRIMVAQETMLDAARAALRTLRARAASLSEKIQQLEARLGDFPGKHSEVQKRQLRANLLEETYRYLLSQLETARLQLASIAPYVTIMDGASPAVRIGTTLRQKVTLGFLVGLILGLGGAFFLEYLDQTIKSTKDIERVLGIPVLGLIPDGQRPRTTDSSVLVLSVGADDHPSAEAYRALRTNVSFVSAEKALRLIVITSSGAGEGKSTTAANLAVAFAQQGTRTLLMDADLRRPLLHRGFNLPQEPGLTDVLIGSTALDDARQSDVLPWLDLLPAGTWPPNPAELLGSEAMQRLLNQLREDYQIIVADTPPTLAVTDAAVLGSSADATMLVIRSGETEEIAATRALEQLRRVQARVAGAVLNGVSPRRDRLSSYYAYSKERRRRPGRRSTITRLLKGI